MIDITSPKVLVPALLFATLSPGMILSLPSLKLASKTTSRTSVLIHAVVLALVYFGIAKLMKSSITRMDLIVPAVLFILLSPGILVSIPPGSFMSGTTSVPAVAVHTLVFVLIFAFLRKAFPKYY